MASYIGNKFGDADVSKLVSEELANGQNGSWRHDRTLVNLES